MIKAENMLSSRGKPVANQIIITDGQNRTFQSYGKVIAKIGFRHGKKYVELDVNYWNFSATTSKYRAQFLGETTRETKAKIENKTYESKELN